MIDGKVACQSEVTVIASQQAETSIGAPTFLSRPEPRVVEVGDDIVLSCTSDGMPAPTVRWERDGEGILIHLEKPDIWKFWFRAINGCSDITV